MTKVLSTELARRSRATRSRAA